MPVPQKQPGQAGEERWRTGRVVL